MHTLTIDQDWMQRVLPDGLPLRTSTLISGPGGSGKPLIGNAFVASWLKRGGSVVFMSLQYPTRDFLAASLRAVGGLDLNAYGPRTAFIELDPAHSGMDAPQDRGFKANLVLPGVWAQAIEQAVAIVPDGGPGKLLFGSALNLLMFSPSYGDQVIDAMEHTLTHTDDVTVIFSASTKPKAEQVKRLEQAADNLIMSHKAKDDFVLHMQIQRMKHVAFSDEEITVPIPPETLESVKQIAHHSRQRVIPQISQI